MHSGDRRRIHKGGQRAPTHLEEIIEGGEAPGNFRGTDDKLLWLGRWELRGSVDLAEEIQRSGSEGNDILTERVQVWRQRREGALHPLLKNQKAEGPTKLAEEKYREVGDKCLGRGRATR